MTMIVAPTDNYNSFCNISDADIFHADRGNTSWDDFSDESKEIALIRATDYINYNYIFTGNPIFETSIDTMLLRATAMLAFYSITIDLFPIEAGVITTSDEKTLAGVGTLKNTYSTRKADRFPTITNMLANIAQWAPPSTNHVQVGYVQK